MMITLLCPHRGPIQGGVQTRAPEGSPSQAHDFLTCQTFKHLQSKSFKHSNIVNLNVSNIQTSRCYGQ